MSSALFTHAYMSRRQISLSGMTVVTCVVYCAPKTCYHAADRADAASERRAAGAFELILGIACQQGTADTTNACRISLVQIWIDCELVNQHHCLSLPLANSCECISMCIPAHWEQSSVHNSTCPCTYQQVKGSNVCIASSWLSNQSSFNEPLSSSA